MSNPKREPYLGEAVHYRSYGTPGGEYPEACRAALVTDVRAGPDGRQVSVVVFNPSGIFLQTVPLSGDERRPGTVHWQH